MELVHHFSIQTAKQLFYSPMLGFVTAVSPLRMEDAVLFGLQPLLLYALEVELLPRRFIQISFSHTPQDPIAFLLDGWRNIDALMGVPDLIKIHSAITRRLPELRTPIESTGARSDVGTGLDKAFTSRFRYVQDDANWIWLGDTIKPPVHDLSLLNARLRDKAMSLADARTEKARHRDLMTALAPRKIVPAPDVDPPTIPWVQKVLSRAAEEGAFGIGQLGIWERSTAEVGFHDRGGLLPFIMDEGHRPEGRSVHLSRDAAPAERSIENDDGSSSATDDDEDDDPGDYIIHELRLIVPLAKSWPGGASPLVQATGMKVKEFNRIVQTERDPGNALSRLIYELGLHWTQDETLDVWRPTISFPPTRKVAIAIYQEISHLDGDLSGELLPATGSADPSFRYHLFLHGWDAIPHIQVFPRGGDAATALDDGSLRFDGGFPAIETQLYRWVVELSARYHADPRTIAFHLKDWWREHHETLSSLMDRWPRR